MSKQISIPLNQLKAINILKKSIEITISTSALNTKSQEFQTICQYCKTDVKYCETTFEYLMNHLENASNQSYFGLLLFLFEKSKTMKQLVQPKLNEIFKKAFSKIHLQEWSIQTL